MIEISNVSKDNSFIVSSCEDNFNPGSTQSKNVSRFGCPGRNGVCLTNRDNEFASFGKIFVGKGKVCQRTGDLTVHV